MNEPIPPQRDETARRELIRLMEGSRLTVAELSKLAGRPEKDVCYQLDEIGRSGRLRITPAECLDCGFRFKDRTKAKKPGKCPACKGTRIGAPAFSVKGG